MHDDDAHFFWAIFGFFDISCLDKQSNLGSPTLPPLPHMVIKLYVCIHVKFMLRDLVIVGEREGPTKHISCYLIVEYSLVYYIVYIGQ